MEELDMLEAIARDVPVALTKNDPRAVHDALEKWLREQAPTARDHALASLIGWLAPEALPWQTEAALELAVRFRDADLMRAAIAEGRRRGVDATLVDTTNVPRWFAYQSLVVEAVGRLPVPDAVPYLQELQDATRQSQTRLLRDLRLQASVMLCTLAGSDQDQRECVRQTLESVRGDSTALGMTIDLLWAVYIRRGHAAVLDGLLTPAERQRIDRLPRAAA